MYLRCFNSLVLFAPKNQVFKRGCLKKLKRYFKIINLILALMLLLSFAGCEFAPIDITDLVRPPKLTGEQQSVQAALEKQIGAKYLLKYPLKGQYRAAFILHDIDGDKKDEAIALYRPQDENAGTHIMVLKIYKGAWKEICDISGDGNEVESINFGDYYGTGKDSLTVGWTLFNNSDYGLGVYNIDDGKSGYTKVYSDSFSEMAIVNIDNNKTDDMLLFKLDPGTKSSVARLITYKDGRLRQVSDAPLDSTVSSYAGVYITNIGSNAKGVLLDGYKGAHSMVTELITWKNRALYTPFYDTKKNAVTSTLRDVTIDCTDIDNDGLIEIPFPVEMPSYVDKQYDAKLWLVRWCTSDGGSGFVEKISCAMNFTEAYYFIMPTIWGKSVTVENDTTTRSWIFKTWDKITSKMERELFEIHGFTQIEWKNIKDKSKFEVLSQINDNVYVVKIANKLGKNDILYLPLSEIQKRFKMIS
jgi:hypothetical protein